MSNYTPEENKSMTSKLKFNLMNFLESYNKQIKSCLNYAYPDNSFAKNAGHTSIQMTQSLSRAMSKYCEGLKEEVENNPTISASEKLALKNNFNYIDQISVRIRNCLEKTYPDGYYNSESAHLHLSMAFTYLASLEEYQTIYKENTPIVHINVTNVLRKPFDYKGIIKRAYPNDQFSETTCHEALQRLRQVTFLTRAFITNVRTQNEPADNDFDLKNHTLPEKVSNYLKDLHTQLGELSDAALIAYPNNALDIRLGHTAFTECIRKINQITKLIAANTEPEDLVKIVKARDEKANPKAPEEFKTKEELEKALTQNKKEEKGIAFKF